MTFTTIVYILLFVSIINAVLLFFTYNSTEKSTKRFIFQIHIISIIGWAVSILTLLLHAKFNSFPTYQPWQLGYSITQLVFVFATIMVATNFWFVEQFINNAINWSFRTIAMGVLGTTAFVLSLIPGALYNQATVVETGYVFLTMTALNGIYSVFLLAHFLLPLILLGWSLRKTSADQIRQQTYVLLFSYLAFFVVSMTLNWLLPVYYNTFDYNALGPATSLIIVLGITYTISKHQFLNVSLILQRGVIYTILFSVIVLVYAALLSVASAFSPFTESFTKLTVNILTIGFGIFTVPRLDTFLRRKTDRIFFTGLYNYRDEVHELSALLQNSTDTAELINICEQKLAHTLRATSVHISTKEHDVQTEDLCVPIKLQDRLVGVIAVGPKKSGDQYSETDHLLLRTFANQAAVALSRALLFQTVTRRADDLEEKVGARTAELEALQQQQKQTMLQISHNLQTPLAILQNKIDTLKQNTAASETVNSLEVSLYRVSHFIRSMLRLSRLEAGHEELKMKTVNLSALLTELAEETAIIAGSDDIVVNTSIKPEITAITDEHKLREIVMNLTSNAIKYMGAQTTTRSITLTLSSARNTITISVHDTGIGIAPEDQGKIFEQFNRGSKSTNTDGTGLGLAITKELTEQLGGTITLESNQDTGSTFTVTLPNN